jgi:hypothetical protein
MKKIVVAFLLTAFVTAAHSQTLAQIKKDLESTTDPVGYVKYKLKKKYKIDTVSIISTTSFLGLPDSLAYSGKTGKVYGPFKGSNVLIKVLAKLPNTFYHVTHIVLDTSVFKKEFADSLASNIIRRIQSGEKTFEDMAGTYSADPGSATKGGDVGWFVRGIMLPQLDEAIAKHKKGDLFKVWTPAGLHVVTIKDNPKKDNGFALLLRVIL